jgi:NAD(P)-dependent dehydrogenase (short-subunit alcohol dehydrogenase family)
MEDCMTDRKVALVTGAARGIGLATAKDFSAQGWQVLMLDNDSRELASAAAEIPDAMQLDCDISAPDDVDAAFARITAEIGRLDCLVNNAGIAQFGPIDACDFAMWRQVMATNLDGTFLCSRAATPLLKASRGSLVNIASISGLRASTLRVAYGTSKAAVIQLTRQQAAELGEFGVRANCVCPGPVRTKLAMAVHTQDIIDAYHDAIPLNRYGSEAEIAAAITFLASDRASYITGQVLAADGGFESTGVGLPSLRKDAP